MTTRNDRQQILSALRSRGVPSAELPATAVDGIRFENPSQQFAAVLQLVGGEALVAPDHVPLADYLRSLDGFAAYERIGCEVPDLPVGNVDLNAVTDPHALSTIDLAIVAGQFAVAENAAVWVSGANVRHRALCVLAQHLILLVPRDQFVHNMHEAYQRIRIGDQPYGVFISGPSKTADIEQSLVIGAHGARSLRVIFHAGVA